MTRKPSPRRKPGSAKPSPPTPGAKTGAPKDRAAKPGRIEEIGGRDGPDPTRYGDWEKDGRCIDF